jgi:lysozyme
LRSTAYLDTKGIPTIGVGHTGPEVHLGLVWSEDKCREVFARDLERFERSVNDCVTVELEQYEFDALVSFAFNCGVNALPHGGNGGPSSILRALNAGDHEAAGEAFNNWMADPEVRTRRAGEREQFKGAAFEARVEV